VRIAFAMTPLHVRTLWRWQLPVQAHPLLPNPTSQELRIYPAAKRAAPIPNAPSQQRVHSLHASITASHEQCTTSGRDEHTITNEVSFPTEYYDGAGKLMLKNLTYKEMQAWCTSIGKPFPASLTVMSTAVVERAARQLSLTSPSQLLT
jgi:hypothetical protein